MLQDKVTLTIGTDDAAQVETGTTNSHNIWTSAGTYGFYSDQATSL